MFNHIFTEKLLMNEAVIRTEKLTKYYGRARGVVDLDIEINRGEIFGCLGPNGAGKTTTIRLLLNLIFPTSGKANVLQMDAVKDTLRIKRDIGYIPGDVRFYENLTGAETVSFVSKIRKQKPLHYKELKKRFDFDPHIKVKELSRGNKQKLAVILAFCFDPKLYILDEPTSGLDPLMQQEFYSLIRQEKSEGKTIFFSSHILPEVDKVCDRVGILKEGKLIRVETIEDLRGKKIRNIDVFFDEDVYPEEFRIEGVDVTVVDNRRLRMVVKGEVDRLVKLISIHKVLDLTISHAPIEETFLEFYGREDGGF